MSVSLAIKKSFEGFEYYTKKRTDAAKRDNPTGLSAWTRWGCFGGMRSDGEKDGSDPILTRRHFAERLDGTGKM